MPSKKKVPLHELPVGEELDRAVQTALNFGNRRRVSPPPYSTDPAIALQMMEVRMADMGSISIAYDDYDVDDEGRRTYKVLWDAGEWHAEGNGRTLAEAISRCYVHFRDE